MGSFSVLDLAIVVAREKKRLGLHFVGVTIAAIIIACVLPKKYKATTMFLPPRYEGTSFNPLSMAFSLDLVKPSEFTPEQIETLLNSRALLEETVNQFNLMKVYKTEKAKNNLEKAIKALKQNTTLKTETQSVFGQMIIIHFTLSVTDRDKQRATDMANSMVNRLNFMMDTLSQQQGNYVVGFIKSRLDSMELARKIAQTEMKEFQTKHKIFVSAADQVTGSISIYTELKKQKILTEIERDLLMIERGKDNRDVILAQKKLAELDQKLNIVENGKKDDILPPLLPSIGIAHQFKELMRENEVLTQMALLLRQQYEEARLKNTRRPPLVRIIDPAVPPQWKNSPKRSLVALGIVAPYMFICFMLIWIRFGLSQMSQKSREKTQLLKSALSLGRHESSQPKSTT